MAVVGDGDVLDHLVELLRPEIRGNVLQAVDDAGLQRMVDLGEGHHLRDGAPCLGGGLQHLGALDAQLEALEVLDVADLAGWRP